MPTTWTLWRDSQRGFWQLQAGQCNGNCGNRFFRFGFTPKILPEKLALTVATIVVQSILEPLALLKSHFVKCAV